MRSTQVYWRLYRADRVDVQEETATRVSTELWGVQEPGLGTGATLSTDEDGDDNHDDDDDDAYELAVAPARPPTRPAAQKAPAPAELQKRARVLRNLRLPGQVLHGLATSSAGTWNLNATWQPLGLEPWSKAVANQAWEPTSMHVLLRCPLVRVVCLRDALDRPAPLLTTSTD